MSKAKRSRWVADDDPTANAAPEMDDDDEEEEEDGGGQAPLKATAQDAAAAAQAITQAMSVDEDNDDDDDGPEKKKKTTMPFTRPQDRPYLVTMLKAFNKLSTPPYADAARKGGVTEAWKAFKSDVCQLGRFARNGLSPGVRTINVVCTAIYKEKVKGDSADDDETGGDLDDLLHDDGGVDAEARELDQLKRDMRVKYKGWKEDTDKKHAEAAAATARARQRREVTAALTSAHGRTAGATVRASVSGPHLHHAGDAAGDTSAVRAPLVAGATPPRPRGGLGMIDGTMNLLLANQEKNIAARQLEAETAKANTAARQLEAENESRKITLREKELELLLQNKGQS